MADASGEMRRNALQFAAEQVEQVEDELRAYRNLLGLCIGWLPHGLLRDTVRQVSEGRSAAGALRALELYEKIGGM